LTNTNLKVAVWIIIMKFKGLGVVARRGGLLLNLELLLLKKKLTVLPFKMFAINQHNNFIIQNIQFLK